MAEQDMHPGFPTHRTKLLNHEIIMITVYRETYSQARETREFSVEGGKAVVAHREVLLFGKRNQQKWVVINMPEVKRKQNR